MSRGTISLLPFDVNVMFNLALAIVTKFEVHHYSDIMVRNLSGHLSKAPPTSEQKLRAAWGEK